MIISFLAPKGGVGSSTLAVLTAVCKAHTARVLLVDAAHDPSLDLYTSTENSVSESFNGSLSDSAVSVRGLDQVLTARIQPEILPDKSSLSLQLTQAGFSELVIDFGAVSDEDLSRVIELSDVILVVLTQDNQVLRAADRLLGQIRRQGGRAGFIINRQESRDIKELGDADEIYGLLEEDCYGIVPFDHNLRFVMNQGQPTEVSQQIAAEIQGICDKIYHVPSDEDEALWPESAEAEKASNIDFDSDLQSDFAADPAAETNTVSAADSKEVTVRESDRDSKGVSEGDSERVSARVSETISERDSETQSGTPETISDGETNIPEPAPGEPAEPLVTTERDGILNRIRSFFRIGKG